MIPCSDSFGLDINDTKYKVAGPVEGEGKAKFAAYYAYNQQAKDDDQKVEKSLQELPVVGNKSLNAIDLSIINPKPQDDNNDTVTDANIAK